MANREELFVLSEEVNNSVAIRISGRLEMLSINFFVFNRNYQELKRIIEGVKKPEQIMRLWDLRNRHELDIVINEVIRLLHNFLASAKSLVEHTRIVISDWYQETEFLKEYETQVASRFVNNPIIGFIEELRNFNLHFSLPITDATLSIQMDKDKRSGTENFSFVIKKYGLLQWSGWTQKGKPFLKASKDEIEIGNLVDDYYQQIMDFHSWMEKRLREIHSEEFAWLSEMNKRIINAMDDEERQARGLTKQ